MSSRVTFTGGRFHRYSLDGDWVPSVTSVTGKVGDKGGLVGGAAKEVAAWAAIHVDELPVGGPDPDRGGPVDVRHRPVVAVADNVRGVRVGGEL